MTLDYTTKGEVKTDMWKYVKTMIDEFTINIEKYQAVTSPETKNLLKVDVINPLNKNQAGLFHTTVARGLFLWKYKCRAFRPLLRFYELEWNIPIKDIKKNYWDLWNI